MFYISLIYLLLLYLFKNHIPNKYKVALSLIPFVTISFIRFGTGADYFAYQNIYNSFDKQNLNAVFDMFGDIELLYKMLNLLSRSIGLPFAVFVGILSSSIAILTAFWIKDTSQDYELSILLYYVMFFMVFGLSALRQGLAMAILIYIFFNKKRNFSIVSKLITSLLMFFVHSSSIIVILLYFVSNLKWDKKKILLLFIFSLLFNAIPIGKYLYFLAEIPYLNKVLYYISETNIKVIFSFPSVIRIGFFLLLWSHYDKFENTDKNTIMIVNFSMLSFILYFFTLFSGLLASRISVYGYFMMVVLIPLIKLFYEGKRIKKLVIISILLFSVVSFFKELNTMVYQAEYDFSIHRINIETIFSKKYENFSKGYSLVEKIREDEKKESGIVNKVYGNSFEIENTVNEQDEYLSVYFPNKGLYGVINQRGEVIELPFNDVRTNIYNDKIEIVYNPFEYKTVLYRTIGADVPVDYKELIEINRKIATERSDMYRYWYDKKEVLVDDLPETLKFEKYDTKYFNNSTIFSSGYHPEFNYIKFYGTVNHYNFILNEDYSVKLEKPYLKIIPYNEKRIAVGYTESSRDYINEFGEIIWTEKLKIKE